MWGLSMCSVCHEPLGAFNRQKAASVSCGPTSFQQVANSRYPTSCLPTRWRALTRKAVPPPIFTHAGDFAVDLRGVLALGVRVLRGGHLQDAHSEGVDVHGFIVLLLVHLWGHELRRSCQRAEVDCRSLSQGHRSSAPYKSCHRLKSAFASKQDLERSRTCIYCCGGQEGPAHTAVHTTLSCCCLISWWG